MGAFYTGFNYMNRKNGYFKIGETGKNTPAARLAQIRQADYFQCLGYIVLPEATKAELWEVESYVRLMMERTFPELTHVQNDHYVYTIESGNKYQQAQRFADSALNFARKACVLFDIEYTDGKKQYKRG